MATKEQINKIINLLDESHKINPLEKLNQVGHLAVLKYLNQNKKVKSKDICENMNISSARMAVLIKKLENKGLITKIIDQEDARITIINLTEKGKITSQKIKNQLSYQIENIINEFGYDNLTNLLKDMQKIKLIIEKSIKEIKEEHNE